MPRPGRSGIASMPSVTADLFLDQVVQHRVGAERIFENADDRLAAARWRPAKNAGAPAQRCGASPRLKAPARASMRRASVSAAADGEVRLQDVDGAGGDEVAEVEAASARFRRRRWEWRRWRAARPCRPCRRPSPAPRTRRGPRSRTRRAKRLASATVKVPWASTMMSMPGPRCRARRLNAPGRGHGRRRPSPRHASSPRRSRRRRHSRRAGCRCRPRVGPAARGIGGQPLGLAAAEQAPDRLAQTPCRAGPSRRCRRPREAAMERPRRAISGRAWPRARGMVVARAAVEPVPQHRRLARVAPDQARAPARH